MIFHLVDEQLICGYLKRKDRGNMHLHLDADMLLVQFLLLLLLLWPLSILLQFLPLLS